MSHHCDACGAMTESHLALWITNTSDVLSVGSGGKTKLGIIRFFAGIGEKALWLLSRLFYYLGRATGLIQLLTTTDRTLSRRSRLLWEEATRRGMTVKQVVVFGLPTDIFLIDQKGKLNFYQSIPFPPETEQYSSAMDDKVAFKRRMRELNLPVPQSRSVRYLSTAKNVLKEFQIVCVKPQSGSNGRHTYPYVNTEEDLAMALKGAQEICYLASIEEHFEGNLCRATCVDGRMEGFLESAYPTVTGDGTATVRELIEKKNAARVDRVDEIRMDTSLEAYVRRRGYMLTDILPKDELLQLTYRGGAVSGGWNKEHGRTIHPSFIPLIEQAARATELPIVGFDLIIPDVSAPADGQRWGFIEANSLPWIDLHAGPLYGDPIDLSGAVWDLWAKP